MALSANSQQQASRLSAVSFTLKVNGRREAECIWTRRSRDVKHRLAHGTLMAVALPLAAGMGTALARSPQHGHRLRGGHGAIHGLVTAVGGGTLTAQTATGSVTVTLASTTSVIREVSGSLADLRAGEIVDVHPAHGAGTQVVHIFPAGSTLPQPPAHSRRNGGHHSGTEPYGHRHGLGPRSLGPRGPARIESVDGSTIRLRYVNGTTGTILLATRVSVVKDMRGQLTDLAVGQMVDVRVKPGTTIAMAVVILNS